MTCSLWPDVIGVSMASEVRISCTSFKAVQQESVGAGDVFVGFVQPPRQFIWIRQSKGGAGMFCGGALPQKVRMRKTFHLLLCRQATGFIGSSPCFSEVSYSREKMRILPTQGTQLRTVSSHQSQQAKDDCIAGVLKPVWVTPATHAFTVSVLARQQMVK